MWCDTCKHIGEYVNAEKTNLEHIDQRGNYDNNSDFAGL